MQNYQYTNVNALGLNKNRGGVHVQGIYNMIQNNSVSESFYDILFLEHLSDVDVCSVINPARDHFS